MRSSWRVVTATIGIATTISTGCASSGLWPKASPALAGSAATPNSAQQPSAAEASARSSASQPSDVYGAMPKQNNQETGGGVVLASLMQAGNSISNALRIQPKVTPPDDPVKLDGQSPDPKVAADLNYHAGYFKETQKRFAEAAMHYERALKQSPNDARCISAYGRVLDQLGNRVEAEKQLRRACELAPQDPAPLSDLAQSYARRQDWNAALTCQRQAVALQPTNQVFLNQMARLLIDAGRPDEAVQILVPGHGPEKAQLAVAAYLDARQKPNPVMQTPAAPARLPVAN